MDGEITERGTLYRQEVGPLVITYLTGKDAEADDPVHRMSMGEMTVTNASGAPVPVVYNTLQTFFLGHLFEFGPGADPKTGVGPTNEYTWPRTRSMPEDRVDFTLAPGQSLPLSRRDLMDVYQRLGRQMFLDGTICTSFRNGRILIAGKPHPFAFGRSCFHVDMDRDWSEELKAYRVFAAEREGRPPPKE